MKRRFLEVAFVSAIAVVAGINVYNAQKPVPLSDIGMANVEALANDEIIDGGTLPEFTITCGATKGKCWIQTGEMCFVGEMTGFVCSFYGQEWTSCASICN